VHSASIRTESLTVMHVQVVGTAVCKFVAMRFKRAKGTVQAWGQKTLSVIRLKMNLYLIKESR
jgi:hypothetical protein